MLIVRESRILQHEEQSTVALQKSNCDNTKRCFTCGKAEHFAKNCKKNKRHIKCLKCGTAGHIEKNCRTNEAGDNANDGSRTAMFVYGRHGGGTGTPPFALNHKILAAHQTITATRTEALERTTIINTLACELIRMRRSTLSGLTRNLQALID